MWPRDRNDEIGNRKKYKYPDRYWSILTIENLTLESLKDPGRVLYLGTAEGTREREPYLGTAEGTRERKLYLGTPEGSRERTLPGNIWGYQREPYLGDPLRESEKKLFQKIMRPVRVILVSICLWNQTKLKLRHFEAPNSRNFNVIWFQ